MIVQVIMNGMWCDGCRESLNTEEYHNILTSDPRDLYQYAQNEGWQEIGGKWYCPECVERLFYYDIVNGVYVKKGVNKGRSK